jgi:putative ABC transport system substrate-binding protein
MTMMSPQLSGKRLEILKATVPRLARVAVFWNPPNPAYGPILKELEAAAPSLNLRLHRLEVRVPADFVGAFETAVKVRAGALIAPGDPLVTNRPKMVADIALKNRMPTMMEIQEFVEAGGLLSYGLDLVDSYRRAATHVDKILKGANPAELPMEQPSKFDLAVNLKTARVLGLTIPPSVLLQATRVIE